MGLKHIVISAVAVTAMVCAYADVEWKIYADGNPNEYGVVGRNTKNPYSGDVVVPSVLVVDFKGGGLRGTFTAIAPSGGIDPRRGGNGRCRRRRHGGDHGSRERPDRLLPFAEQGPVS